MPWVTIKTGLTAPDGYEGTLTESSTLRSVQDARTSRWGQNRAELYKSEPPGFALKRHGGGMKVSALAADLRRRWTNVLTAILITPPRQIPADRSVSVQAGTDGFSFCQQSTLALLTVS
jgi:hypothetical protein